MKIRKLLLLEVFGILIIYEYLKNKKWQMLNNFRRKMQRQKFNSTKIFLAIFLAQKFHKLWCNHISVCGCICQCEMWFSRAVDEDTSVVFGKV